MRHHLDGLQQRVSKDCTMRSPMVLPLHGQTQCLRLSTAVPGGPLIGRTPPPMPPSSTCRASGGWVSGGSRLRRTPLPPRFHPSPAAANAPGSATTNVSYVPLAHSPTISYTLHAIPEGPGPSPEAIPGGLKLARTPPGVERAFAEPPAPLEQAPSGMLSETPQVCHCMYPGWLQVCALACVGGRCVSVCECVCVV
jgi:hypothetical protein